MSIQSEELHRGHGSFPGGSARVSKLSESRSLLVGAADDRLAWRQVAPSERWRSR
jgi:hypothetical protein